LTFVDVVLVGFVTFELNVFGVLTSIKVAILGLLKIELSLFRRIIVFAIALSPFTWRAKHEQQFFIISCLAQYFMGIISSQIKIERILSMVGIIIGFRHYRLGIENLDKLVLIMKILSDDLRFGCTTSLPKSIEEYLEIKDGMVLKNEKFITDFNLFEKD
jgi:hypothetical protein